MTNFNLRSYALVTAAYWAFTLTDGALRMLVLLHFHELGFSPVQLAFLFLLYEAAGIVTNLIGGWIGSRYGLKKTLFAGLALQVVSLAALAFIQDSWILALSVGYVMAVQALSGVAKDLTKMSSKSAVKLLVPADGAEENESKLFKWVAILTGSKNALKGVGFFLGGLLLSSTGFNNSLWIMAAGVLAVLIGCWMSLKEDLGRSKKKVKFNQLFSKNSAINHLSFARSFLFASRDVWFVVGLPVFLHDTLGWGFASVGGFMAAWVIGYGFIQASAPKLVKKEGGLASTVSAARLWSWLLVAICCVLSAAVTLEFHLTTSILVGLAIFGAIFAVNSAVHSYLILAYTCSDKVSINVGFYYMANACGRLVGTLLSGLVFIGFGLTGCLWTAALLSGISALTSHLFPKTAVN